MATYGRSFKLKNAAISGISAPCSGDPPKGEFTRKAGMYSYYEVSYNSYLPIGKIQYNLPHYLPSCTVYIRYVCLCKIHLVCSSVAEPNLWITNSFYFI